MNRPQTLPQYRQVADTLRRRIRNGVYRQGDIIPSLVELEDIFDVSSITVRKALGILADEGWVEGRRGIGTLVIANQPEERVAIEVSGDFREWLESASGSRWPVEQEVLDITERPAPPMVARSLGVAGDTPLWCMRRIRRIEGAPISYHLNFGCPSVLGRIDAKSMASNGNFVDAMREVAGIELGRMDQRVEALNADRDLADILEVEFGDSLFFVENRYASTEGDMVAVTHLYLRGDRYVYQASIVLDEQNEEAATTP